jgi:hypothetical protein
VGAHVENFNSGSIGISVMGNYSEVEVPPEARRSLAELLAWEADRHDLDPHAKHQYKNPSSGLTKRLYVIAGHRDAGSTECPGDLLYAVLDDVRDDTAAAIGDGKGDSLITLTPSTDRVDYGDPVTYSGVLTDENGTPLAARDVTLYRRYGKGAWKSEVQLFTGLDGSFSHTMTPKKNVKLLAVFEGDSELWGAQTDPEKVEVAPDITLASEGGTPDENGVGHYPAGTKKVWLSGAVVPTQPEGEVKVTVKQLAEDGSATLVVKKTVVLDSNSAYRYRFVVPGPGTFRAVARFLEDAEYASKKSEPVVFVIDSS